MNIRYGILVVIICFAAVTLFGADPLPVEKQLAAARAQIVLLQSQVRFLQAQNQALIAQIEANKANENYRQIEAALTGDAACQLSDTQTIQCPEVQDAKNTSTSADSSPGAE